MTRAQDAYMQAYASATGAPVATTAALARRLIRPWQLLTTAPLTDIGRATGTRQADPVLEALRQRYLTRRRISFVVLFVGFFAFSMLRSAHL